MISRAPLLMLASACLASACGSADAEQQIEAFKASLPDPTATRVEVVTLQASKASLTLDLPGEVEGSKDALLGSPAGGFVESVRVARGDEVRKGDVLMSIDYATRKAQLDQAEAQLAQAQDDLARAEALGDLATASRLASLRTAVAMAKASVDLAGIQASRALVRAPFEGVVSSIAVDPGEIANPGSPVVRVVQLDPVKVVLSVSDRDVVALEKGMPAWVTTASSGAFVEGTVQHIEPAADLKTRAFRVEVELPNADRRILPGMIARVKVDRTVAEDRVVVPQDWLVTTLDGYGAYVAEGDVVRWRDIELGDLVRGQVIVEDGLAVGDRIVVTGQHQLVDGDPVLVAREGTCCTDGRPTF